MAFPGCPKMTQDARLVSPERWIRTLPTTRYLMHSGVSSVSGRCLEERCGTRETCRCQARGTFNSDEEAMRHNEHTRCPALTSRLMSSGLDQRLARGSVIGASAE
jgi:hypothetical protein